MRIEPYKIAHDYSSNTVTIHPNRRDIIYPKNSSHKKFLNDAVISPLKRGKSIGIDCGRSKSGGDFTASELKQIIEEEINCEVSKPERRLVWDRVLRYLPYLARHTFLWITGKYSDFQREPVVNEVPSESSFDYNSSTSTLTNDYISDNVEDLVPQHILDLKRNNNVEIKVVSHFKAEDEGIFSQDLEYIGNHLKDNKPLLEILGVDFSGVAYSDGLLIKRTSIEDIVISMNGVDITNDEYQSEIYDKILAEIVKHLLSKRYKVTVQWGLSKSELEEKLDLPLFNNIKCELFYSDVDSKSSDAQTQSVFTP